MKFNSISMLGKSMQTSFTQLVQSRLVQIWNPEYASGADLQSALFNLLLWYCQYCPKKWKKKL